MTEPRDDQMGDDQLAAMLEARADRLPPTAAREVMAAVRGEIQGPKGGALFSVVPVTRTHAMSGPASWAAVGLVAALVLAVVGGGRLDSEPSTPAGSGAGSGSPVSSAGATRGPAATAMASAGNTITVAELRAGLDEGSLNGRIVLLTGSLRVTEFRCFTPQACGSIEIVGLEGVEVSDRWWGAEAVLATVNAHPGDSLMAFRAHVSGLELLGWPQQDPAAPVTVARLAAGIDGISGDDLAIVSGWLGPWLVSCESPSPSSGAVNCRDMRPALADGTTGSSGTEIGEAVEVTVAAGSRIGDAFLRGMEGPFLVRHNAYRGGDLPPYEVVASLNPPDIVRVETMPSAAEAAAEQLRAALEDGSMDGRLIAVTGWLQPSGALCPADVPQPCTLFVILGLGIGVTWDGHVSTTSRLYGEVVQPPSTTASTLVVTPRNGHLALLGRLIGNLERPASIQELTDGDLLWQRSDPLALTAVAGWLVVAGIHSCPFLGPDATPCPGPDPLLTDVEPSPDGRMTNYDRQQPVRVWPGAVGIDPAQVVTPGPFLYRIAVGSTCDGLDRSEGWTCAGGPTSAWEVMARYDASTVFRVLVP